MSTYYTLEYLAIWEEFNNPDFNRMGYQSVRNEERLIHLNTTAITQMKSLLGASVQKRLK